MNLWCLHAAHSLFCNCPFPILGAQYVIQLLICIFTADDNVQSWGTSIRGLMRGMATLPQGNQELLVVKDKVGRPPGELGVIKSMECDIFPFSAVTLLVGRQEGIRPVKNWMLVCLW